MFTAPERERIEATYGAMLGEAWAALKRETLVCAVAALRAHQARVPPRFAAAEDAARLADETSLG